MSVAREEIQEVRDGLHSFPIRPADIDILKMSNTFGKSEVETTAINLVKFFQRMGGWYPFTIAKLEEFYREIGENPNGMFFGLLGCWLDDAQFVFRESHPCLVVGEDGMLAVTDHFIKRCAGHYRDQKRMEECKIYYKVVIARGERRANIQYPYYVEAGSDTLARYETEVLAERLTSEHGIAPDKYWVAYVGRIFEEPLFRDPRLSS